jgi:hypothetical protein
MSKDDGAHDGARAFSLFREQGLELFPVWHPHPPERPSLPNNLSGVGNHPAHRGHSQPRPGPGAARDGGHL